MIYLQISILIMTSHKISFIFIFLLRYYYLIKIRGNCNKTIVVFWLNNSIYNFYYIKNVNQD